jgi:hypothetical protein
MAPHNLTYEGVSKSFRTESITKCTLTTINTRWEETQRVMAAKLTRLTHKIVIQLHLVAERCTICSSRCRRPVRELLGTPAYVCHTEFDQNDQVFVLLVGEWEQSMWFAYFFWKSHEHLSPNRERNASRLPASLCLLAAHTAADKCWIMS